MRKAKPASTRSGQETTKKRQPATLLDHDHALPLPKPCKPPESQVDSPGKGLPAAYFCCPPWTITCYPENRSSCEPPLSILKAENGGLKPLGKLVLHMGPPTSRTAGCILKPMTEIPCHLWGEVREPARLPCSGQHVPDNSTWAGICTCGLSPRKLHR